MWANLTDENKEAVRVGGSFGGRNSYGPLLVMLKADKQAVLVSRVWRNTFILTLGQEG